MLHVWAEDHKAKAAAEAKKAERQPLAGSPFAFACSAGLPSAEASFVEGWSKESRAVDKHGKAVDARADLIIAGDAVIVRPTLCDALGNLGIVLHEDALSVHIKRPDGSMVGVDAPSVKFIISSKGGVPTYDLRHDTTQAGDHEAHIFLNSTPIRGSPLAFHVVVAVADVKNAKLEPPQPPLFVHNQYTILLRTFDRFGNPRPDGGLAVGARLQIVKSHANDLTTLVPNNHSVEIIDNENGTYSVNVTLKIIATIKVTYPRSPVAPLRRRRASSACAPPPASARLRSPPQVVVNMDKNIPASGGDLAPIPLSFIADPVGQGTGAPGGAPAGAPGGAPAGAPGGAPAGHAGAPDGGAPAGTPADAATAMVLSEGMADLTVEGEALEIAEDQTVAADDADSSGTIAEEVPMAATPTDILA